MEEVVEVCKILAELDKKIFRCEASRSPKQNNFMHVTESFITLSSVNVVHSSCTSFRFTVKINGTPSLSTIKVRGSGKVVTASPCGSSGLSWQHALEEVTVDGFVLPYLKGATYKELHLWEETAAKIEIFIDYAFQVIRETVLEEIRTEAERIRVRHEEKSMLNSKLNEQISHTMTILATA